ncbi:MAG: hypothetical protein NTX91_02365 [candidate division SR1 bacterium]|nr:hypothetical protein [candidate division SR1 bacterium]
MEKSDKFKERFEQVNSKIGSTIEMTPEIREILGTLYEEEVFVKDIEVLSNESYKVKCRFPEYKGAIKVSDHISVSQFGDAIKHAAYVVFGLYIKNNPDKIPFTFENFLENRMNVVYKGDERDFIKKIRAGEDAYMIRDDVKIEKTGPFTVATARLKGTPETFVRGKVKCLLEDKYL